MSGTLHHPETVNKVAKKIFLLVNPIGDFDTLDDDQLASWQGEAVALIDTALEAPTNGIAFFEEVAPIDAEAADELLEPWKELISPAKSISDHPSSGYRDAVSGQVEAMRRDATTSKKSPRRLSLVPELGGGED